MTGSARRIRDVLLHHLPSRQLIGSFLVWEERDIGGRSRQFFAQQSLNHPVATEDRTGARGSRLLGMNTGQPEDAAPAVPSHPVDAPPLGAGDARNAVVSLGLVKV